MILQSEADHATAPLLQRGEVACRLRAEQPAEAEIASGDRQLVAGLVNDLDEETGVGPPLWSWPVECR